MNIDDQLNNGDYNYGGQPLFPDFRPIDNVEREEVIDTTVNDDLDETDTTPSHMDDSEVESAAPSLPAKLLHVKGLQHSSAPASPSLHTSSEDMPFGIPPLKLELRKPKGEEEEGPSTELPSLSTAQLTACQAVVPMHKQVRIEIHETYKPINHIMAAPRLDPEWKIYCELSWPEGAKVPENAKDRVQFEKLHPGYAYELEMIAKHNMRQAEALPMVQVFDDLLTILEMCSESMPEEVCTRLGDQERGTSRCVLDALQLQGDHLAKITQARRENFMGQFELLAKHLDFAKDSNNYDPEETRVWLFGKTFINNLLSRAGQITQGLTDFSGALQKSQKMGPKVQKPKTKPPNTPSQRGVLSLASGDQGRGNRGGGHRGSQGRNSHSRYPQSRGGGRNSRGAGTSRDFGPREHGRSSYNETFYDNRNDNRRSRSIWDDKTGHRDQQAKKKAHMRWANINQNLKRKH